MVLKIGCFLCSLLQWNSDRTECLCKHLHMPEPLHAVFMCSACNVQTHWRVNAPALCINVWHEFVSLQCRYCVCELPYNPDAFMIMCSKCEEW